MSLLGSKPESSSTHILLAEHERLSQLYLYNADLGEKRTAQYLGVLTLVGGGILGLSQLKTDEITLIELSIGALAGVFVLGIITFFRLVERRVRATEYLRAINRIHAYFVTHDSDLANYFSWPTSDDVPAYVGRFSDLSGLRDLVAVLNGMAVGLVISLTDYLMQEEPRHVSTFTVTLGLIIGLVVVLAHLVTEAGMLKHEEKMARARERFPHHGSTDGRVTPGIEG